jgi:hypothetical protein
MKKKKKKQRNERLLKTGHKEGKKSKERRR